MSAFRFAFVLSLIPTLLAISAAGESDSPPWADNDHPEIDYAAAHFMFAVAKGHGISGWWTIRDRSTGARGKVMIAAENHSRRNSDPRTRRIELAIECVTNGPLFVSLWVSQFPASPEEATMGSPYALRRVVDSEFSRRNREAEDFLRVMWGSDRLRLRLPDGDGGESDFDFELAGIVKILKAVENGCGLEPLDPEEYEYRRILAVLNAFSRLYLNRDPTGDEKWSVLRGLRRLEDAR